MGGEIGLMLGASLLTFVEFMDLILFLLYHQVLRLYKRKKIDDIFEEAEEVDVWSQSTWFMVDAHSDEFYWAAGKILFDIAIQEFWDESGKINKNEKSSIWTQ